MAKRTASMQSARASARRYSGPSTRALLTGSSAMAFGLIVGGALFLAPPSSAAAGAPGTGATATTVSFRSADSTLSGDAPAGFGSGSTIEADVDPTGEAVTIGETFPTEQIGLSTIHPDGSFAMALALDSTDATRWAAVNGGHLNVQLILVGPTGSRMSAVTYTSAPEMTGGTPIHGMPIHGMSSLGSDTVRWGPFIATGAHPEDTHPVTCSYSVYETTEDEGRIGEAQVYRNASGTFIYGRTAQSHIGVSFDGGNASAGAEGTIEVSNTLGERNSYPIPTGFDNYFLTQFQGSRYNTDPPTGAFEYCDNPGGKTQANVWQGGSSDGAKIDAKDGPYAFHEYGGVYPCLVGDETTTVPYVAGGKYQTDNQHSYTFDSGLTLGFPGVSVSLSTFQGFNVDTSTEYDFGKAYSHNYTCGKHTTPNQAQTIFNGPALN